MTAVKTYHGSCHCQANQFEINCEPIDQACRCNCSICRRKGATMSDRYFLPDEFSLIQGEVMLTR